MEQWLIALLKEQWPFWNNTHSSNAKALKQVASNSLQRGLLQWLALWSQLPTKLTKEPTKLTVKEPKGRKETFLERKGLAGMVPIAPNQVIERAKVNQALMMQKCLKRSVEGS